MSKESITITWGYLSVTIIKQKISIIRFVKREREKKSNSYHLNSVIQDTYDLLNWGKRKWKILVEQFEFVALDKVFGNGRKSEEDQESFVLLSGLQWKIFFVKHNNDKALCYKHFFVNSYRHNYTIIMKQL